MIHSHVQKLALLLVLVVCFALAVTVAETPKQAPNPTLFPAAPRDPKVEELRKTLDRLKTLKSKGYKDGHPDVARLKRDLERLEKDMTPEQIARAKEPLPPAADDAK